MLDLPIALQPPDPMIPIRPVRLSDSESLYASCWSTRPFITVYNLINHIQHYHKEGRGLGVVIEDETGAAAGYGQFVTWHSAGELSDLVIAPHLRGQGYGTAIIQHLVAAARAQGIRRMEIGATVENVRAAVLYRRLGFADSHTVSLNLGNGKQEVLFLALDLQP
jgi:ribosomal protein S18 acetylase RimI-like enzyme